ncbi:MAG: endonuclease III [Pseudomonadota bacterium]
MSKPTKRMKKDQISALFARFAQHNPEPKGELNYTNPYTLLVAVTLSAQATDVSVNKATQDLFASVQTPKDMIKLGEEALLDHIRTIGLYNTKAKNLIKAAQILIEKFDGEVPQSRAEIETLPGAGRKTANVVMNIAFGAPTIAVDTHLFRLANRLGLAPGKTPLVVENALCKNVPEEYLAHAHHWLILHGRYTCLARKPRCAQCIVHDLCNYSGKIMPT